MIELFKVVYKKDRVMKDNKNNKEKKYGINNYKKSNLLISSKYTSTITENKIQAIALASIQNAKENEAGNLECTFSAAELRKLFGDDSGSLYKRLDSTAKKMTGSVIGYTNEETQSFEYISVISKAKYEDSKFTIIFNGELKNQILDIQEKYTILNLPTMMKFEHVYSFRLYEYIKSEYYKKKYIVQERIKGMGYEMTIPCAEMRLMMGTVDANEDKVRAVLSKGKKPDYEKAVEVATRSKFKEWKEFKRSVIDVAVKEINEKTELNIVCKTDRAGLGGKAVGISFIITDKEQKSEEAIPEIIEHDDNDILNMIDEVRNIITENLPSADLKAILESAGFDLEKIKNAYQIAKTQKNIDNLTGWMIKAIQNEYKPGVGVKGSTNKFNNFPQSKINYDELEAQLLDN